MPSPLATRLDELKTTQLANQDHMTVKLVQFMEELLELIEQNRNDLTEAYEAQIQMTQRLDELEKRLPQYQGPRA
jgi:hypothetical protein